MYIIYVNSDDGTPPGKDYKLREQVNQANAAYDSFLNFYICGYHHINSSQYTNLITETEKAGLYNTFHVEDAINVYIVNSVNGGSAKGDFPWNVAPNNNIWMSGSVPPYTLAHEVGHYLGLFHTFLLEHLGSGPGLCFLKSPQTDIDMVPDTPYDPGPADAFCVQECPIATTPCTLSCYNNTSTLFTYTYVNYLTNNIMSYHQCASQEFTDGQIDRMKYYLTNSDRSFLLAAQPTCINDIAEVGYINKYCMPSGLGQGVSAPVKQIEVKLKNNVTNWEGQDNTSTQGEYVIYQNDYSNLVNVTIKPTKSHPNVKFIWVDPIAVPAIYHPLNGVSMFDVSIINKHILGITPLPKPYNWVAADINNSSSITIFDLALMRKVILGLETNYPAGTWRFLPEFLLNDVDFNTNFNSNPFNSSYNGSDYPEFLDEITLDMDEDAMENESSWSFHAIKVGDVNCNASTNITNPDNDNDKFSTTFPSLNCVDAGENIALRIGATSDSSILAYQLGIKHDETHLEYQGVTVGNLPDFSHDNFGIMQGEIKTVWYKSNSQAENISSSKTLFVLHYKVLSEFCDLSQVVEFTDDVLNNAFYGSTEEALVTNLALNYQIENRDGTLTSAYPNPATNNGTLTFNFELNQSNNVTIHVSDYLGNYLTYSNMYSSGSHSYSFNNLTSLTNGALNYVVTIGTTNFSGALIKSTE